MGTISSSVGLFSGIDSKALIDQLLAVEARPKTIIQRRIAQLQAQTAAVLDLNSRLAGLRTATEIFRNDNPFDSNAATTSDANVLTGTATNSAAAGTYSFLVDRLVSSQQVLSRGFADRSTSAVGVGQVRLISAKSRLDVDTALSDLNDGSGISRGKFTITDRAGGTATIDLSKAAYVSDVLDAINSNTTARVRASVVDDRIVLTDTSGGGGSMSVAESGGGTTAQSLGLSGSGTSTITGTSLRRLTNNTLLSTLNDGRGVNLSNAGGSGRSDFTIAVNRAGTVTNVAVNLGEIIPPNSTTATAGPVATLGEAMTRMNDALSAAGFTDVRVSLASDGKRLLLADTQGGSLTVTDSGSSTAARDLGLSGSGVGSINGRRIASGINTALGSSLNGGRGIGGDGTMNITLGDSNAFTAVIDRNATLSEIAKQIEDASVQLGVRRVSVSVSPNGLGLVVRDLVGGPAGLSITGTTGDNTAAALGIATSTPATSGVVNGTDLARATIGTGTLLANMVPGRSFAAGRFRMVDSTGKVAEVSYDPATVRTVGDLIAQINSRDSAVKAAINDTGDGIVLRDTTPGGSAIRIEDTQGTLARDLGIAGTATGTDAANRLDGTTRKTITLTASDTLQNLTDKINASGSSVRAAIVQTGSGTTPFQLSLFSSQTGREGRFVVDSGSLDLGLRTIDAGENARVFYGSTDLSRAVLLTSSSNTLDNVISGVKIDLKGTSDKVQTISVTRDTAKLEKAMQGLADAFNSVISRIDVQSRYDEATRRAGPLLGDATALSLRSRLFQLVQGRPDGVSGKFQTLSQVGLRVGEGGSVTFDATAFRAAMAEDPDAVRSLVSARVVDPSSGGQIPVDGQSGVTVRDTSGRLRFTQLGLAGKFEEFAKSMLDSVNGTLTNRKRALDDQVAAQNSRIGQIDQQLAARRTVLEAQFRRMESAIGQLQAQQSSLSALGR